MKKKIIVGNWKMYVSKAEDVKKFAAALRRKLPRYAALEIAIAPPYVLIPAAAAAFGKSSIKIGAQSVSIYADEKRTGEVSAAMLKQAGAQFVIVGHSERRAMGESVAEVRAEVERSLEAGLMVVLCIGEVERDQAGGYLNVIVSQLSSALENLTPKPGKLVVAYEPVWAIGKSADEAMKPHDLREMSIFIRKTLAQYMERAAALKIPILYGGAVESSNARALLEEGDVQGFLVGHASAQPDSFAAILETIAAKK